LARTPVLQFVGESGSGKTILIERLIPQLQRAGLRVATIKHQHGDVDTEGKDSFRHLAAGAELAVLAGDSAVAVFRRTEKPLALPEVAAMISGVNLILVEGFKEAAGARVFVSQEAERTLPAWALPGLAAVVAPRAPLRLPAGVAHFQPAEIGKLAAWVTAFAQGK